VVGGLVNACALQEAVFLAGFAGDDGRFSRIVDGGAGSAVRDWVGVAVEPNMAWGP